MKSIRFALVYLLISVIGWLFYIGTAGLIGSDFDAFFLYQVPRSTPTAKIVIVKIDNESLDVLGKSDFRILAVSKKVFIAAIDKLRKAGARSIGIDVVLVNPDPNEEVLSKFIAEKNDTVIAAKIGGASGEERVLPNAIYPKVFWGMIDVFFDKNIVTKIRPLVRIDDTTEIEHFSIAVYKRFLGSLQVGKYRKNQGNMEYVVNPIRTLDVDSEGYAYIPFSRKIGEYPSISLYKVLSGDYPEGFFKDSIVLIGEQGTLIHDAHFSPISFGKRMPGVEFHAQMIDSLMNNAGLKHLSDEIAYGALFLVCLMSCWVVVYSRSIFIAIYFGTLPVVLLGIGWFLHAGYGVLIPLYAWLIAGWLFPFVGGALYRYFIVDSKRRFLSSAFGHYVAPEVVANLSENPSQLMLGGRKQEVAIFFSDIAGFTSISEKLGTEKLFELISEYLSEMTDILIANKGTLDKYIGDAVMGFYGAPLPIDTPCYWACKTAIEQQKRLHELSEVWESRGLPRVVARIGIHFGEVMVGNIGSKNRFNYTAMGDDVNLASRLEGVNKAYGTLICVSQDVVDRAGNEFVFRMLDVIRVKGKTEPVAIYELLGFLSEISHETMQTRELYASGMELYRNGEFQNARAIFKQIPNDPPANIMSTRCLSLVQGKTHLNDGVFEMTEK